MNGMSALETEIGLPTSCASSRARFSASRVDRVRELEQHRRALLRRGVEPDLVEGLLRGLDGPIRVVPGTDLDLVRDALGRGVDVRLGLAPCRSRPMRRRCTSSMSSLPLPSRPPVPSPRPAQVREPLRPQVCRNRPGTGHSAERRGRGFRLGTSGRSIGRRRWCRCPVTWSSRTRPWPASPSSRGSASSLERRSQQLPLVVPATPPRDHVWTEGEARAAAAASAGEAAMACFAGLESEFEGEVGDGNPMLAIEDALRDHGPFDEIVLRPCRAACRSG